MKPSDIKVNYIYRNRGKGKVLRFVLDIGDQYAPTLWFSERPRPVEPGVLYRDSKGREECLYLSSFASWCGTCVVDDNFIVIEPVDFKLLEAFKDL